MMMAALPALLAPLLVISLFLSGVSPQETLHPTPRHAYKHGLLPGNWSRLEHRLNHRIHNLEHKLRGELARTTRALNYTQSLNYLNVMYRSMAQEYYNYRENVKQEQEVTQKRLTAMDRQVARQEAEMKRVHGTVDHLQKMVMNLTDVIKALAAAPSTPQLTMSLPPTRASTVTSPAPTTPKPLPTDCEEALMGEVHEDPSQNLLETIQPRGDQQPFTASCKVVNNMSWTLIQRRTDGSEDFYRTWDEYKSGFGSPHGEFWIGNDHLHYLSSQGNYKFRVELVDWQDKKFWAEYDHFRVEDEDGLYRLHVHGPRGNAGDSLTSQWGDHNNQAFSTHDRDNDERFYDNCAKHFHGAWWFKACFESHLNGVYYDRGRHNNFFVRDGIQWNSVHLHSSLKATAMMVARNPDHIEANEEDNHI